MEFALADLESDDDEEWNVRFMFFLFFFLFF